MRQRRFAAAVSDVAVHLIMEEKRKRDPVMHRSKMEGVPFTRQVAYSLRCTEASTRSGSHIEAHLLRRSVLLRQHNGAALASDCFYVDQSLLDLDRTNSRASASERYV